MAGSSRTSSAGADGGVEPGQVADVLAVDVDVDEPVEVAVVGQQLTLERRMLGDERVDDAADRVAGDVQRLDPADIGPEHGRDEDRAHARASGEIVPARPVVVSRNGASAPTAVVASGRPLLRASTAASEQTGHFGSRRAAAR